MERLPKSRRYRLTKDGYRICVFYLKLFEKLYAPLASAILNPFRPDKHLLGRLSELDQLYAAVLGSRRPRRPRRIESRLETKTVNATSTKFS